MKKWTLCFYFRDPKGLQELRDKFFGKKTAAMKYAKAKAAAEDIRFIRMFEGW